MSSFSSVVRKPGQKITPKVAPRRAIQRHAAKTTPAVETLTPESLPQSPITRESPPRQESESADLAVPVVQTAPTPPPTAAHRDGVSFPEPVQRPSTPEAPPEVIATSPVRRREDTVPLVATSQVSPDAIRTRRASATVRDAQTVATTLGAVAERRQSEANTERPAKRRKVHAPVPDPDANIDPQLRGPPAQPVQPVQPAQSIPPVPAVLPVLSRHSDQDALGTDALLHKVNSGARTITELANSIEARTRHSRSRTNRLSPSNDDSDDQDSTSSTPSDALGSATIERLAAAVVAQAVRGKRSKQPRHRRGHTPEDAENHKIDEATTSMADLLTDSGLGKRSQTGKRLDSEWAEIKSRWDQKLEQNRSKAKLKPSQRKATRDSQPQNGEEIVNPVPSDVIPQMQIVNGIIHLAEESRQIDFSQNLVERANAVIEADVQNEERIYNYVNQNRIGKKAGLRATVRWDTELTDKFYQGLRMFGTDFELITSLFGGGWTRRQIKSKFVREERANIGKIRAALAEREQVDLSGYGAMTGTGISGLRDPKEIQAEIEAEEKRIRDEYEKAKNGNQLIEDEADMPIESIETDAVVDGETDDAAAAARTTRATPSENRFSAMADKIVKRAGQPSQKKQAQNHRKQREHTGTSRAGTGVGAGRKSTRGKKPLEGVEERIGNVGDVEL